MEESKPRQISIVYEKVSDRPTVTATGAFGGPSPDHNSVVAQLYVEHASVPSVISHEVREDMSVDFQHGDAVARGDATREIQATLVLSPEAAILIGDWLMKKGLSAVKNRGKIEGSSEAEE